MSLLNGLTLAGVTLHPMIRKDAGFALLERMTAYKRAVARDPMAAGSEFLEGIGVPPAKGI